MIGKLTKEQTETISVMLLFVGIACNIAIWSIPVHELVHVMQCLSISGSPEVIICDYIGYESICVRCHGVCSDHVYETSNVVLRELPAYSLQAFFILLCLFALRPFVNRLKLYISQKERMGKR